MDALIHDFSFGLFFWLLIVLAIVVIIVGKYAWRPIIDALEERERGISEALASAEKVKLGIAGLTNENEQLLKEARVERDNIVKEAKEPKDMIVADARTEEEEAGKKIFDQAIREVQEQKNSALVVVKSEGISISEDIV